MIWIEIKRPQALKGESNGLSKIRLYVNKFIFKLCHLVQIINQNEEMYISYALQW